MKQLLKVIFIISFFAACKKNISSSIRGLYIEESPVNGRSQLNFINWNLVIKSERGSNYADTFKYLVIPKKILLTPKWTNQSSTQEFDFEKIDESTIKIQNLYPSIPESPKSYMIYKKK